MNEITINLTPLTEAQRNSIAKVLDRSLNTVQDETNEIALEELQQFNED